MSQAKLCTKQIELIASRMDQVAAVSLLVGAAVCFVQGYESWAINLAVCSVVSVVACWIKPVRVVTGYMERRMFRKRKA